jgi:hypothetical protein
MTMNRHESFEELISASLTGDLTPPERQRLDAHLDSCAQCRATLAAFADQRRIMTGLRHVAPPRDLGARVRTGIERGRFAPVPWWRRPAVIFTGVGGSLAAVAGALLAIVLLNGAPSDPEVGQNSPTPTLAQASASEEARTTLPPIATPAADASPAESAPPSVAPTGSAPPIEEPPEPDIVMVAAAEPSEAVSVAVVVEQTPDDPVAVEPTTDEDPAEPMAPSGPPVVAELSPDAQWLAFITENGERGTNELWATRIGEGRDPVDPEATAPPESSIAVGETVHLGMSTAPSPFLERMSWSSDGRYLAYTVADPDTDDPDTDAWVFETFSGEARPLTDVGNAYAASFIPGTGDGTANLWVSVASEAPLSYVMQLRPGAEITPGDPAELGTHAADVFQPLLSPNGSLAIFWRGRMTSDLDRGWIFEEDGIPYLAEHDVDEGTFAFANERKVFSDLPSRGSLFASAAIAWGLDGDAYAIWDTAWTGEAAEEEPYPDATRVYFGHATDNRGMTRVHAIDRTDVDPELVIVDVEVAPTGQHLLITARARPGGVRDPLRAELWLVTRHTGDVPDESKRKPVSDDGWVGPAVFLPEPEWDSSLAP